MRRPEDEATLSSSLSYLVSSANHVILMGGGLDLLALKVTALVDSSLVVNQLLYDYVNSVNMFFIIKPGRFNDLGESVVCGTDGLLSL